jgi:hypothetical protein
MSPSPPLLLLPQPRTLQRPGARACVWVGGGLVTKLFTSKMFASNWQISRMLAILLLLASCPLDSLPDGIPVPAQQWLENPWGCKRQEIGRSPPLPADPLSCCAAAARRLCCLCSGGDRLHRAVPPALWRLLPAPGTRPVWRPGGLRGLRTLLHQCHGAGGWLWGSAGRDSAARGRRRQPEQQQRCWWRWQQRGRWRRWGREDESGRGGEECRGCWEQLKQPQQ